MDTICLKTVLILALELIALWICEMIVSDRPLHHVLLASHV